MSINGNTTIRVDVGKVVRDHATLTATIHATGARRAVWRIRCAMPFMWLASKIAGVQWSLNFVAPKGDAA